MAVHTPAELRQKIIDLWQAGKLIPGINVFRWPVGSQSDGTEYSLVWGTHKLDFTRTWAKLYGPSASTPGAPARLIQEFAANMNAFANTIDSVMPWPTDEEDTPSGDIDDAYAELEALEAE